MILFQIKPKVREVLQDGRILKGEEDLPMSGYPTLKQIQEAKEKLRSLIVETPAHPWHDPWLSDRIGHNTEVFVKLELLQVTGTFKPRGALNVMFNLDKS